VRLPPELLRPPALPSVEPAFDRLPPLPFASVRPALERDEPDPLDLLPLDRLPLDRLPLERDELDFVRDEVDEDRDELDLGFARDELDFARDELDFVRDELELDLGRERDELDFARDELDLDPDELDLDPDELDLDRDELDLERDELDELDELRLDERRRVPPLRSAAGISSRATAFASCSICFSRNLAIRSSSRRMLRASFAVSLSPTVSASDSMPAYVPISSNSLWYSVLAFFSIFSASPVPRIAWSGPCATATALLATEVSPVAASASTSGPLEIGPASALPPSCLMRRSTSRACPRVSFRWS
jgi:hypothetical protein